MNYLAVLYAPHLGRVEMLEANAQNALTQINRIAERDNGVDAARLEFGDNSGNWAAIDLTRGATPNADGEVRVTNGAFSDRGSTARFRAKVFKAALVAALQDVERLKRQSIISP